MMDDIELRLSAVPPPPPARAIQARIAAVHAFDQAGRDDAAQGDGAAARQRSRNFIGRLAMTLTSRALLLGGSSAAVLAFALYIVVPSGGSLTTFEPAVGEADRDPAPEDLSAVQGQVAAEAEARAAAEVAQAAAPATEATREVVVPTPDIGPLADNTPAEAAPADAEAPTAGILPPPSPSTTSNEAIGGLVPEIAARESLGERALLARPRSAADTLPLGRVEQGRDRFPDIEENGVQQVAESPVSTFSIDVDTSAYSVVRDSLNRGALPHPDAVRVEELINYFPYDYPAPEGEHPFAVHVTVSETPWNAHSQILRIGLQGQALETPPRANLVFLIDTSGSMDAPDKLPLLLNSFRLLLDSLDDDDTVAIVAYAGSAGTVLEPTAVSDRVAILSALQRLSAGGSTAGGQGLALAYDLAAAAFDEDAVNRVILATDGDFNVGIQDPAELEGFIERQRETGIYLSVLGFGAGNYNDTLMQTLSQAGNGVAAYIDTLSEARKVLVDEATSQLFPIAEDVKIQLEFNPAHIAEYRLIGYETRALAREDFNNDQVDAGEIGAGHRVTALYEVTPVGASLAVSALRYQPAEAEAETEAAPFADELAFLRLRYKRPGEDESQLIERPISLEDRRQDPETDWAVAVAAFGQLLRGGRNTSVYDYDNVLELAQSARGDDPFGYRAEFLNLVRLAQSLTPTPR